MLKMYLKALVPWRSLGVDKDGNTICVVGISELIEEYNRQVYDAYKNNEIDQHSVGMIYVNIDLAVNNPESELEFKNWNEVYPLLGNPEKADAKGYFWIIREAKLKEYSCVLWMVQIHLHQLLKILSRQKSLKQLNQQPRIALSLMRKKNEKEYYY
jgi:hypothetical protein